MSEGGPGEPPGRSDGSEGDADVPGEWLRELHDHLAATAELPVETAASRYLGEAEAVVADALGEETPDDVVERRVEQARKLLGHVDGTGDETADQHVAAAKRLARELDEYQC
ncbi:hypothetical protein [Halobacterium zhouii]|uniref:hypothetical protein n=1 Tax=Halobacterium zhouii TaxID=2902624 RepID=UPI001E33D6BD|nr:hypothetical protein [Halobacterium zhouii]